MSVSAPFAYPQAKSFSLHQMRQYAPLAAMTMPLESRIPLVLMPPLCPIPQVAVNFVVNFFESAARDYMPVVVGPTPDKERFNVVPCRSNQQFQLCF